MIDNITYDNYQNIINELSSSKANITQIVELYSNINDDDIIREMNNFLSDLEKYIKYLSIILKMNIDADNALKDES